MAGERPRVFPEYSPVRVRELTPRERWTDGGEPSIGDQGTVVRVDRGDAGVFYTVESSGWIAELSHDELEPLDLRESTGPPTSEPTPADGRADHQAPGPAPAHPMSDAAARRVPAEGDQPRVSRRTPRRAPPSRPGTRPPEKTTTVQAAIVLGSAAVGGLAAGALSGLVAPEAGWVMALVLGVVSGLVGGLGAGNVVEALVVLVLLSAVVAVGVAFLHDPFRLSLLVSMAAGLGCGHLTAGILGALT